MNMSNKRHLNVVTITLNPALDLTGHLHTLTKGKVNQVKHCALHPAGKGVNVARVLAELGANVTATGFLGGENEQAFCRLFAELEINDAFIRVQGATRINVKLVETTSEVSDINFPGVSVCAESVAKFEQALFALAEENDVFILSGSLPIGITPEMCASWIRRLQQLDKKVLFDSSNDALASGLLAGPWLVKPNADELAQWAGKPLNTTDELLTAAEAMASLNVENVVVSLGEKGVMWLSDGQWLRAIPPTMEVVSTVGAGDSLVAGICWGQINGWESRRTLAFATALSALAVTQTGVELPDVARLEAVGSSITIM